MPNLGVLDNVIKDVSVMETATAITIISSEQDYIYSYVSANGAIAVFPRLVF